MKILFIEPGSLLESGYIGSISGKLRDKLLDREIFMTLTEVKVSIEQWRREYNHIQPHSAVAHHRIPTPETTTLATLT